MARGGLTNFMWRACSFFLKKLGVMPAVEQTDEYRQQRHHHQPVQSGSRAAGCHLALVVKEMAVLNAKAGVIPL